MTVTENQARINVIRRIAEQQAETSFVTDLYGISVNPKTDKVEITQRIVTDIPPIFGTDEDGNEIIVTPAVFETEPFWDAGGNAPDEATIAAAAALSGTLNVTSDKPSAAADGIDTVTVSCSDAAISGDSEIGWRVYDSTGRISQSGTALVAGGTVSIQFKGTLTGSYTIEVFRNGANQFETGFTEVSLI